MAGDKKTILDIVKEVDRMDFYEKGDKALREGKWAESEGRGPFLKDIGHMADLITRDERQGSMQDEAIKMKYRDIPDLAKEVLAEEHPTAGGTYKGSVYFSNILPEGQGDIPWTKEAAIIVEKASQTRAKKSDILAAQNYFAKIGYMHPSEVDGMPGRQFRGMVSRWNKNAGVSKEAMFDAMETWKDNIFGGDEE